MLLNTPAVILPGQLDVGKNISADTIGRIHKLLKSAFSKAVVWDYLPGNPAIGATFEGLQKDPPGLMQKL